MENRISQIILDLYRIREDPIENFDKIPGILDKLGSLGLEYPELARMLEYKADVERISGPLEESISLKKCVERYLSAEFLATEETGKLREYARQLYSVVDTQIQYLKEQSRLLRLKITKDNLQMIEDLLQKLIGHRLEAELIPNLLEKMGYKGNTTTFGIPGEVVEIDGRYERDFCSGARNERLVRKDVVIAECKATIDLGDIKKFQAKAEMLKGKYVKDKENWNYQELNYEAWMVACYGWTEKLLEEAKKRDIVPLTSEKLEHELKRYRIFDPRIPICPASD